MENKKLTPLEAFRKIREGSCKGKYQKYCDIVETALKEKETRVRLVEEKKIMELQIFKNKFMHSIYRLKERLDKIRDILLSEAEAEEPEESWAEYNWPQFQDIALKHNELYRKDKIEELKNLKEAIVNDKEQRKK